MLTVTDVVYNGSGALVPFSPVYAFPGMTPLFVKEGGLYEPSVPPRPHALSDSIGVFSLILPWPSETDPSYQTWTISLVSGSLTGAVPEGVTGPVTLHYLLQHGWTLAE